MVLWPEPKIFLADEILLPPARAAGLPAHHVSQLIPPAMVAITGHWPWPQRRSSAPVRSRSRPISSSAQGRSPGLGAVDAAATEPDPATLAAIMAICMMACDPRELARYLPKPAA